MSIQGGRLGRFWDRLRRAPILGGHLRRPGRVQVPAATRAAAAAAQGDPCGARVRRSLRGRRRALQRLCGGPGGGRGSARRFRWLPRLGGRAAPLRSRGWRGRGGRSPASSCTLCARHGARRRIAEARVCAMPRKSTRTHGGAAATAAKSLFLHAGLSACALGQQPHPDLAHGAPGSLGAQNVVRASRVSQPEPRPSTTDAGALPPSGSRIGAWPAGPKTGPAPGRAAPAGAVPPSGPQTHRPTCVPRKLNRKGHVTQWAPSSPQRVHLSPQSPPMLAIAPRLSLPCHLRTEIGPSHSLRLDVAAQAGRVAEDELGPTAKSLGIAGGQLRRILEKRSGVRVRVARKASPKCAQGGLGIGGTLAPPAPLSARMPISKVPRALVGADQTGSRTHRRPRPQSRAPRRCGPCHAGCRLYRLKPTGDAHMWSPATPTQK